ncbi:MAG: pyridoxamine 5'-phosphate oxidase [Candidatus Eremiobacteraeota bacterium]|nr:pyridoxamine 5'-phosphate oxidase [Candidatus Eremiobacteraeota bacterium]
MNLNSSRRTYDRGFLEDSSLGSDPIAALRRWIAEAHDASEGAVEANAMCLATVGADCAPSARIVLLRGLDERGLVFYTSYFSRKGEDLEHNNRAAATFYWPALERQVRVEGTASQLSEDDSDAYFDSRPRGHRLSAWASEQSQPLERREVLEERMQHFDERFGAEEVPRPHSWGGYAIAPSRMEFWQGRPSRLHDRLQFERIDRLWTLRRLQP